MIVFVSLYKILVIVSVFSWYLKFINDLHTFLVGVLFSFPVQRKLCGKNSIRFHKQLLIRPSDKHEHNIWSQVPEDSVLSLIHLVLEDLASIFNSCSGLMVLDSAFSEIHSSHAELALHPYHKSESSLLW